MGKHYLVASIYNPYVPQPVVSKKGITETFTYDEAIEYVSENKGHLNPLAIIEINEKG